MLTHVSLTPRHNTHAFRDSNDNRPYNENSEAFNLEACGRKERARISIRVNGYWSSDVITIYIERDSNWQDDTIEWKATMTHSSGGRLTSNSDSYTAPAYIALESDLDAEECFGRALIDGARVAREILTEHEVLEHWYQIAKAEKDAARMVEKAAQQAKIDADLAIGEQGAKVILNAARHAVTRNRSITYTVYERGFDTGRELVCQKHSSFITWTYAGSRMSEENVIETLATASIRTNLKEAV